jgi:hypothetical protein
MNTFSKIDTFQQLVERELGEYLVRHELHLVNSAYQEARHLTVLFYRNSECSLAIYNDPRNGEINAQLGQKNAPFEAFEAFGTSGSVAWSYLPVLAPDVRAKTLDELCRDAPHDHSSQGQLSRIRCLLEQKLSPAIAALGGS